MKLSLLVGCLALWGLPLQAQTTDVPDPRGANLTRAELQDLLARYEANGGASREADLIRQRLAEGDLRVGDRVEMRVERQETLTGLFPVLDGRVILLPELGEISVAGVLRSELEPHLRTEIGRFIRDPVVHARALIRLEIMGAVGTPGFHMVASDILISDALMVAGGPVGDANLEKVKVKRGGREIWSGERLRTAMVAGRTLDQLNLQAGDAIEVPLEKSFLQRIAPVTGIISALGSLAYLAIRVF
jgi:protein involved in polysaccharide export with SLBB domain